MRAADDLGTGQRLVLFGLVPQGHDAGHLLLRDLNLPAAVGGLLDPAHAKVVEALGVLLVLLSRRRGLLIRAAS